MEDQPLSARSEHRGRRRCRIFCMGDIFKKNKTKKQKPGAQFEASVLQP